MRYLGVDPGGKRMGLALGDDLTGIATPLEVMAYGGVRDAARIIAEVCERHGADRIVLGMPCDVDGRTTPACARSEALAEHLRSLGLHVELQNEYLSSHEARRRAHDAGVSSGRPVDHFAAQVVLEDFLANRQHDDGTVG